ncbi:MAG: hypothetical protein DI537_19190 [Stutzerimonas stutzeri]|nr:MAG: hypothetical protein DI537_19190 [Stutzerimonas stutzeri]
MARNSEVELVIRAKDAATQAIDSIKDALADLSGAQKDAGDSAKKTDGLLGQLGQQLNKLNTEARGLAAFAKVASEIDKAGAAVSRLEGDVRKSAGEFAKLARETETASRNADRLRGDLAAEQRVLEAATKARAEAAKQLREATAEVKKAERQQDAYNKSLERAPAKGRKGVGTESFDGRNDRARESYGVFAAADLTSARAAQSAMQETVARLTAEIDRSKIAVNGLQVAVSAASTQQRKLSDDTEKASSSLARSRDNLNRARGSLGEISTVAAQASAAMGGMAVDQDRVAQSSARMAAEIARTKAQIDSLANAKPVAATTDRRALLESRRDYVAAQNEVKRLGQEMRSAAAPTEALGVALGKAQAVASVAARAYETNRQAVARLKNEQGTLSAFLVRTATDQQRAANAFVQAQAGIARGNQQITTSTSAATAASNALPAIAARAKDADDGFKGATGGARSFREALMSFYGEGRQSLSLFQRIRGELLSLAGAYIGLYGAANQINGILAAYQKLEAAQSRLSAAFNGNGAAVSRELQFISTQAQRLGIDFGTLSDQYSKFAIAASSANFQADATRRVFLSMAEAGRVNKLTTDQINGAFLALTQMISKGKVSAEELRGQLGERLPGAFNLFADALGVSTAELNKMLEQGEVLANQATLVKFAEQLDRKFGSELQNSLKGTTAEIGRFWNSIFEAQVRVGQAGFIDAFTNGLRSLNEYFASREGRDFFLAIGAALARVTNAVVAIVPYFGMIAQAIGILIALKLASYFTGVVAAMTSASGAFGAVTASTFALSTNVDLLRAKYAGLLGSLAAARAGFTGLSMSAYAGAASLTANGVAVTALRVGLSALGAVAGVLAGTFRVLWAAIGGVPGIILTGLTIALTSWLTKVGETNSAIDEHKRIMGEVNAAYEKVRDTTKDWGKEVKNVTLDQANANVRKMREEFEKTREAAKDFTSYDFRMYFGSAGKAASEMNALRNSFVSGKLSATNFRVELEKIYATTKEDNVRQYGESLLTIARSAEDAEKRLGAASVVAQGMGSSLQGVDKDAKAAGGSLEGLSKSSTDTGEAMKRQLTEQAKSFSAAISEITKAIPSVGDELERLDKIDALARKRDEAIKLAQSMGQVQAAIEAFNSAANAVNIKSFGGTGLEASINMLKQFEGFKSTPYWDTNAYRVGYGSDTVTLSDGTIQKVVQGIAITEADALRDLVRRIGEFQDVVKAQVGADRFSGFDSNQQAVLTSIAYNYGRLPQDIVEAIKTGTKGEVAAAIRNRGSDNNGINRGRRNTEAATFESGNVDPANEIKRQETASKYNADLKQRLELQAVENANEGRLTKEATIQKALQEEKNRAEAAGVALTQAQIEEIRKQAAAAYDVANAKRQDKTSSEEANTALQQANALAQQRNILQQQFNTAQRTGDSTAALTLQTQLTETNLKLQEAIDKARTMWQAIGGPEADVALTKLDNLKLKADASTNSINFLGLSAKQVEGLAGKFADGFVGALDSFAQAVANGENAVQALGKAFLQFAADFLREIAKMILKQMALNAIKSVLSPFGISVGTGHTGGKIGSVGAGMGNMRRAVAPALFAGALAYHGGGIAGLAPDEVPAVLKKGEEIITEADPRHRDNDGAAPAAAASGPTSIRNVVLLDPSSAADFLGSSQGEQVILSVLKKNSPTVKQMIG